MEEDECQKIPSIHHAVTHTVGSESSQSGLLFFINTSKTSVVDFKVLETVTIFHSEALPAAPIPSCTTGRIVLVFASHITTDKEMTETACRS